MGVGYPGASSPPLRQVSISKCGYEAFYTFTRRECALHFYITRATTCWMNSKSYTMSVGSFFETTQSFLTKVAPDRGPAGQKAAGSWFLGRISIMIPLPLTGAPTQVENQHNASIYPSNSSGNLTHSDQAYLKVQCNQWLWLR